ncbi:unnamed protein product [Musa acuminata subsp. malaccensis]|uniref:(wild Malaysian banana) hypothetical protein n=1 Tax=Musa acuminata subsp. malaccensis TaxID=214687 RepID=A0A804L0J3_MUSAM|nr:unnamed protein product [Musa acuminata subsp. malaccensis]
MACILMPNRVAIATLSSPSWLLKPTYCKHAILLRMKKEKQSEKPALSNNIKI